MHVFNELLKLVKGQLQAVEATAGKVKVIAEQNAADVWTLFLVGGLGSNEYLKGFLEEKLDSDIEIRQPQEGYASINVSKGIDGGV